MNSKGGKMNECKHLWVLIEDAEGADEYTEYFTYWECELCGEVTGEEPDLEWEDDFS